MLRSRPLRHANIRLLASLPNAPECAGGDTPMTKLDKPLRREVQIGDKAYTLTIDPDGLKLVEKGHRKGVEVSWASLASGEGEGASDRKGVVRGKSGSVRVDLGGRRNIKKKKQNKQ